MLYQDRDMPILQTNKTSNISAYYVLYEHNKISKVNFVVILFLAKFQKYRLIQLIEVNIGLYCLVNVGVIRDCDDVC